MAQIATDKGIVFLDDDIAQRIKGLEEYITFKDGYPRINIVLHQFAIGKAPVGMHIDHINRNPLDARRSNLRFCTPRQNYANTGPRKGQRFKGVSVKQYKKRHGIIKHLGYRSKICLNGKDFVLGVFPSEEEAAYAYDLAAKIVQGEYAYLNFPQGNPGINYVLPEYIASILRNESDNYVGMSTIEPGIFLRPNGKFLANKAKEGKRVGKVFECIEDARAWRDSFLTRTKDSALQAHTAL